MAGNRIRGITVEIGGDTTKLQTALKGVNTEIRNTQSQLKDVEKLLKLDPGNTELIAQKHRLLAQVVSETREKLLPVTGVVTGLGTAAVKTAADFDSAMSKVAAVNSVAADMVVSPQMAVADGGVMTGTGTSGGADLTAGIVAALKDVLGDQKGQQGDLVIPVYLGNQLLDEVIVTAQQRMSLRSGGR